MRLRAAADVSAAFSEIPFRAEVVYTAALKRSLMKLRRTMKPMQVSKLQFVPSVCRTERNWDPLRRRLGGKIVIEMTALLLKCGKLSGLRHLLQFEASETD